MKVFLIATGFKANKLVFFTGTKFTFSIFITWKEHLWQPLLYVEIRKCFKPPFWIGGSHKYTNRSIFVAFLRLPNEISHDRGIFKVPNFPPTSHVCWWWKGGRADLQQCRKVLWITCTTCANELKGERRRGDSYGTPNQILAAFTTAVWVKLYNVLVGWKSPVIK